MPTERNHSSSARFSLVTERWTADLSRGGPRRARAPVTIEAYVPASLLADWTSG